ncbi:hypothetical protein GCM10011611_19510 [Aliidongia dinghuensis]|uniref:Aminopeptidase n=1 Tax=Aliidongia dinghuensis TaxID=1867774 RepID=A0A8J3E4E7_9PROT|nr:aminopeptidase [Aliidongia dinghuensis]GGF13873.1 hypothetical protein GCM10011611_19510 [Aliidongia dinghuensis]
MQTKFLRPSRLGVLAIAALLLAGCVTRSISNSGYPGSNNPLYHGELSDFDVLGAPATGPITDTQIAETLASAKQLAPHRNERILVIQSGAMTPDSEMLSALGADFSLGSLSGVPGQPHNDYARQLRLIAAQGGYGQLLCYWGTLESSKTDEVTKAVSWVPIAGWLVPDQTQKMRIVLRAVLVDVATGHWRMYRPLPIDDEQLSAMIGRRSSDQDQVARLKDAGYSALAHDIVASAE